MWTANSARVRDSGSGSGPSVHSNPTATERLAKGLQLQREGHLEDARSVYESVLADSPCDAVALHRLGLTIWQHPENA